MYNLLIAGGVAIVGYLLGFVVGDRSWIVGFIPAILGFGVTWFLLARRTGKSVEALFQRAMAVLQGGKIDEARAILEGGMPLAKWQILVREQIHAQIGALDYMQAVGHHLQKQHGAAKTRFASASAHLSKSWSRDWRARSTLAVLHHREGRPDDAIKVLEAASGAGKSEPLFWGIYTFVLNEARRRDEALKVLGRALAVNKDSKPLKELQEALANKRRPDMKVLGEGWFQMFPEDIPRERLMEMQGIKAQPRPQKTYPMPRGGPRR